MKPILVIDFETNGLPLWNEPSDHLSQPHIVQAAAILVDQKSREEIASINLIAKPDQWSIPADVSEVHGITTKQAETVGVGEEIIVAAIWDLWTQADFRLAHNETFDARIMRIALKRFMDAKAADEWKAGRAECTALLSTPILRMPATAAMHATGRHGPKKPKLSEAYEFFTGNKLENAHSAIADVRGCLSVYWAIKDWAIQSPDEERATTTEPEGGAADMPFLG